MNYRLCRLSQDEWTLCIGRDEDTIILATERDYPFEEFKATMERMLGLNFEELFPDMVNCTYPKSSRFSITKEK